MKRVYIHLFFAISLCLLGCEEKPLYPENAHLYQVWTHAFEEQEANTTSLIFRPSDSQTFAPSRYRETMAFNADGTCEFLVLHPADAHYTEQGTFTYDAETRELVISTPDDQVYSRFTLLEVDRDRLLLERK